MERDLIYVEFVEVDKKPKTVVWSCRNKRSSDELGIVKWFAPWRRYCYFPKIQAVYSAGCLQDIKIFIDDQMEQRKKVKS